MGLPTSGNGQRSVGALEFSVWRCLPQSRALLRAHFRNGFSDIRAVCASQQCNALFSVGLRPKAVMLNRKIMLMLGPSIDGPGGMSAVARSYRDSGLFEKWNVNYICTYETGDLPTQIRMVVNALRRFVPPLLLRRALAVHLHSSFRGSFWRKSLFAVIALALRVPVIFHLHSGGFGAFYTNEARAWTRAWIRYVLRHSDVVLCLTDSCRTTILEIEPSAKTAVIGNPVEFDTECEHRERNLPGHCILFLGRLRATKGVGELLRAMPAVLAKHPDATLCLAGDGGKGEWWRVAGELGIQDAVMMPGWVEGTAKASLLRNAALLVLPSHFEALPISILEAMSNGVPVVASRVGGIPDVIEDNVSGLLVPAHDPQALAAAILRVLGTPALARRLSLAGRSVVESRFSATHVSQEVGALYRRIGEASSHGRRSGG